MTDREHNNDDALREAVEKTVPSDSFSSEAIRAMVEKTAVDSTPEETAGQFLRRTQSDPRDETASSETITRFGDTSEIPAQITDQAGDEGARFTVVRKIGSGATSQVYAVRDNGLARTIAVKFLKQSRGASGKARERFLHEARVTAQLEHPNIMPIHDIGLDSKSRLFFTMKNVRGRSVGEAIRAARRGETVDGFAGVADVVDIFFKVCDAVGYAHDHGYIHQDIKPDNIMLGGHGEVLLLDWGCALDRQASTETAGTAIYGTPAYMSPEQARRELADERSDIYCLGATLYHMLTLHHPTWADDAETFWAMKCAGELSALPQGTAGRVPEALLHICRTAMAPDREKRYPDIASFRNAVRQYRIHAESITLTAHATERLKAAVARQDYTIFAEVTHDLRQALQMWTEHAEAREAATRARRAYASCALQRGDLQLAESVAGDDPALADIRESVEARKAEQQRRRRRIRVTQAAAAVLGIAVLGLLAYLGIDYFRHFGTWRTVYHWNVSQGAPKGLVRGVSATEPMTVSADSVAFDGRDLVLPYQQMLWVDSVRVPYDVRLEIVAMWPRLVDGLELHIQARRERMAEWSMCPAGFSCQFGGWRGLENWISRQDISRPPTTSNAVGADFEARRWYRLAFERRENTLVIYVDGRKVLEQIQLLPLPGKGFEHLAIRCWSDLRIRSITVRRMALPRKASPLVVGDDAIVRGDLQYAVDQYLRLADDFPEDRVAEPALAKAYLAACQLERDREKVKGLVRARLADRFPHSPFWAAVKKVECVEAWKARRFDDALALLADVFVQDPETRLALELLALRGDNMLPAGVAGELLSWVGRTTRVKRLDLRGLGLSTCEPVRGMDLVRLDLSHNDIVSLEPLSGMPLRSLSIGQNRVEDLSPLKGMPLEQLHGAGNLIADLRPLHGSPLSYIGLAANRIADLSPLRGAPLRNVILVDNRIESLEPLRGMTLVELDVGRNRITSLEPLAGMPLEKLSVMHNPVSELRPLKDMPLRGLSIGHTNIADLSTLATCSTLTYLTMTGCPVRDLSPLRNLRLEVIDIADTRVSRLDPLRGMPFREVSAESLSVSSLAPLRGTAPIKLQLTNTPVSDISAFDFSRMEYLRIAGTQVGNVPRLGYSSLRNVDVRRTPIRDLHFLRHPVPAGLRITTADFDRGHLEECIRRWRAWGDSVPANRLEARLAIDVGDFARAERLARPFDGHRYLLVGGDFTYEEADSLCGLLGAHILTVGSAEEYAFTREFQRRYCEIDIWLALPVGGRPARWLTGEPMTFQVFDQAVRPDEAVRWYQLEEKGTGWFYDDDGTVRAGFIAEWDDIPANKQVSRR